MHSTQLVFGPFRFNEPNECLWRGTQAIQLRPKAFAVLKYLLAHNGTLVTKQQLLDDVWPETFVGDAVLKDCIRQLRHALDDDPKSPQFIERRIAAVIGLLLRLSKTLQGEAETISLPLQRQPIASPFTCQTLLLHQARYLAARQLWPKYKSASTTH
jgi:hypothetical protein